MAKCIDLAFVAIVTKIEENFLLISTLLYVSEILADKNP